MRSMKILAVIGSVALLLAGAARAAEETRGRDSDLELARQHAAQAKVHYDLGEFEKAAEEYILVYRLRPLPALLFNIAQSYRQAGQYEKAKQFYQSYLRENPDEKTAAAVKKALKEIDELQAKERQAKNGPPTGVKQPPDASLPIKSTPAAPPSAATAQASPAPASAARPPATTSPATEKKPDTVAAATPAKGPATTPDSRAVPAVSRPAAGVGGYSAMPPTQKTHTARWVVAGATAAALVAGGAFGLKTLSSRSTDDAKKANLMYGIGGGLAAVTGAMFLFDF